VIKKNYGLDINVKEKKRKDPPQNRTQKEKGTQNPPSLGLFTFIVWLHVDASVVIIIILLLCFRKWLFSYVSPCPQNIKIRLITSPRLMKIGIEHGSWNPSFLFLECPHYKVFLFIFLFPSLLNFLSLLFMWC
jgi:hypothetical protein